MANSDEEQSNHHGGTTQAVGERTLESAESYVAGSPNTGKPGDGSEQAFPASFRALLEWGESHQLIRQEEDFPFFKRAPDGHGDEHEAWFDEASNRWFKATYHNKFGLAWGRLDSATCREYLTRLLLQNRYFGDDIQLVALVNCGNRLRIVTSKPHIKGGPASYDPIVNWFQNLGFVRVVYGNRIAWYRQGENLLVADAHEGNVLLSETGVLVPIDLNVIQPSGELLSWILKQPGIKAS